MKARKQLNRIVHMEDRLRAIGSRAHALISVGTTVRTGDGRAICQLGYDILRDVEKLEDKRCKLFSALHRDTLDREGAE